MRSDQRLPGLVLLVKNAKLTNQQFRILQNCSLSQQTHFQWFCNSSKQLWSSSHSLLKFIGRIFTITSMLWYELPFRWVCIFLYKQKSKKKSYIHIWRVWRILNLSSVMLLAKKRWTESVLWAEALSCWNHQSPVSCDCGLFRRISSRNRSKT